MADANWDEVGRNFADLGHELRKAWAESRSDEKATATADLKDAGAKVKAALDEVAETINRAAGSPEVREATKQATSSIAEALGTTLHQVTEWVRHPPAKDSAKDSAGDSSTDSTSSTDPAPGPGGPDDGEDTPD